MGEDITKLKKNIENIKKILTKKATEIIPKEKPEKPKLP